MLSQTHPDWRLLEGWMAVGQPLLARVLEGWPDGCESCLRLLMCLACVAVLLLCW